MDYDWVNEFQVEFPVQQTQKNQLGLEDDLVELLWQNGEIMLHNQSNRKPCSDLLKHKQPQSPAVIENATKLTQDHESVTWIHCPNDESFQDEFYSNFLGEIPSTDPVEANKLSGMFKDEGFWEFGASEAGNVIQDTKQQDFGSVSSTSSKFEAFDQMGDDKKASHLDQSVKRRFCPRKQSATHEFSGVTLGSSHCGSNQVLSKTLSTGVDVSPAQKVSPTSGDCTERETVERGFTSSSGGSGGSSWKTGNESNISNLCKRKSSDVTELESASGSKSMRKMGSTRRSRVAEVHNLSERRRRDRINEKMRVLQELIPHSNKPGKASMLDDVIEYMKSLQSQIQLMWMGSGMAPMMLPGVQPYMSRIGMGIVPAALPPFHNIMRMAGFPYQAMTVAPISSPTAIGLNPVLNPANYQHQMQNAGFHQQFANYQSLYSTQNTSQPIMNMFGFGSRPSQLDHPLLQPGNSNGSAT